MSSRYRAVGVPAAAEEEEEGVLSDASASDDGASPSKKALLALGAVGLVMMLVGVVVCFYEEWPHYVEMKPESGVRSLTTYGVPIGARCGTGTKTFKEISFTDPTARSALRHLISQTQMVATRCDPPIGLEIEGDAEAILSGTSNSHSVRMDWKYANDCSSITYRTKMLPKGGTGFEGQINYNFAASRWMVLLDSFKPAICDISTSVEDSPNRVQSPNKEQFITDAAKYAVLELNYRRKQAGCDGGKNLVLDHVQQASEQLSAYHNLDLEMVLKMAGPAATTPQAEILACATVFVNYMEWPHTMNVATGSDLKGSGSRGNFSICADPSTWGTCSAKNQPGASAVQLYSLVDTEDAAADPTQRLTLLQRHFGLTDPVELSASKDSVHVKRRLTATSSSAAAKAPIMLRYINKYNVPGDYDPRLDRVAMRCLDNFPIYDQGSCGCCYAMAMAQMFGLRKCILDARAAYAASMSAAGTTQNPSLRRLQQSTTMPPEHVDPAPGCEDDAEWRSPNGLPCAWFAEEPARCAEHGNRGQLEYCRKTCHTCPNRPPNYDAPPDMEQYLYSAQDIATCSCNEYNETDDNVRTNCDGNANAGCNGGSMWAVWDAWMRLSQRKLRKRTCAPLTIKCLDSSGVTNPMSTSQCSQYSTHSLWAKPCSCIPSADIPKTLPQCGRTEDSCTSLMPPFMVYQIMTTAQGLTAEAAVENMQRHILEEGPIYSTFEVKKSFFDWYSPGSPGLKGDVFAKASGANMGGHAVILTGWGTTTPEKPWGIGANKLYWHLRNSWSDRWGLNGYAKVLAGKNLMGIETRAAAGMMGEPYDDFTPPQCVIKHWSTQYNYFPKELCKFELDLEIRCTEEATFVVHWSQAVPDGDTSGERDTYSTEMYRCPAGVDCLVNGFDLLYAGYGLADDDLYIKIHAYDRVGNRYSTSSTITLEQVNGMTKAGGQASCGIPTVACVSGCVAGPWPEPPLPPPPAPSPVWQEGHHSVTLAPLEQHETYISSRPDTSRRRFFSKDLQLPDMSERLEKMKEDLNAFAPKIPKGMQCFPPGSAVRMADGTARPAASLRAGMHLLARDGATTGFLQDFHEVNEFKNALPTRYLVVEHALQRPDRPLVISPNHLLKRGVQGTWRYAPAAALRVGDAVLALVGEQEQESAIIAIREAELRGFSAPLSASGELWVEDVLVSSYAILSDTQFDLWRDGPSVVRNRLQEFCHILVAPFRMKAWLRRVSDSLTSRLPVETGSVMWKDEAYLRFLSGAADLFWRVISV